MSHSFPNLKSIGAAIKQAVVLGILFCTFAIGQANAKELLVRVPTSAYTPFFTQSDSGEWGGLSIELTEALLNEAGFTPRYAPLPFKRALKHLEKGSLDMMLNLTRTKERESFINFVGPQLDEAVVLVVSKNADLNITALDDIKQFTKPISVELGKLYGEAFEEKRANDKVFSDKLTIVQRLVSSEKMLLNGHTNGFLGYGYHVFWRFKTNPMYENFTVHPFIFRQDWVHFGFSKQSVDSETLDEISTAFNKLEKDGTLEEIRNRYKVH